MKRACLAAWRRARGNATATAVLLFAGWALIADGAAAEPLTHAAIGLQVSPSWLFGAAILPPMLLLVSFTVIAMMRDRWRRD